MTTYAHELKEVTGIYSVKKTYYINNKRVSPKIYNEILKGALRVEQIYTEVVKDKILKYCTVFTRHTV